MDQSIRVPRALRAVACAAALAFALQPGVAAAQESTASAAGIGVAATLSSIVYGPVKVVYAALGGIFGGFAWVLSGGDNDVADAVLTPAIRGDYVVTPAHLRGEQSLEFIGRRPDDQPEGFVVSEQPQGEF